MDDSILDFISFIKLKNGIADKEELIKNVERKYKLNRDGKIYYSDFFAVRFSTSKKINFSNTVIALSQLKKYDTKPFFVCLVTPENNVLYLANTTFIKKISHSSKTLREDNIRGSINGSDIEKIFSNLKNTPKNFQKLFEMHEGIGFHGNLKRLVKNTRDIKASRQKFSISSDEQEIINQAPQRAFEFIMSEEYKQLKNELDGRVKKYEYEILKAGLINNQNIRGRVIEYLISGENESSLKSITTALRNDEIEALSTLKTSNELADHYKQFDNYKTGTDIKTKIMSLNSNPKASNVDKLLKFLAKEKSVFMFYFIGIKPGQMVGKHLTSIFQMDLFKTFSIQHHWTGKNSRGTIQFKGETIRNLILSPNNNIDIDESKIFLKELINS